MHWNRTNRINSLLLFSLLTLFHYLHTTLKQATLGFETYTPPPFHWKRERFGLTSSNNLRTSVIRSSQILVTCKASMRVSTQQLLNRSPRFMLKILYRSPLVLGLWTGLCFIRTPFSRGLTKSTDRTGLNLRKTRARRARMPGLHEKFVCYTVLSCFSFSVNKLKRKIYYLAKIRKTQPKQHSFSINITFL